MFDNHDHSPAHSDEDNRCASWWTFLQPYFVALVSTTLAAWVRWLLDPVLGKGQIYLFFVLASFLTAWKYGWKPGVFAVFLGLAAADYLFLEPRNSFAISKPEDFMGIIGYLSVTGMGILITESRLSAQKVLFEMNATLEKLVSERTSELSEINTQLRAEIATRRQAEHKLRRTAAIITSLNDAVVGASSERVFDFWNVAAEKLFGYASEEVMGKPISLLIPSERLGEQNVHWEAIMTGQFDEPYETVRLRKDGSRFPVVISMSPVRNDDGAIVGASAIMRDISYTKRLEEQLREASKMEAIGQLAAGVAHDFNNVLTIICGFSDVALMELPAGDPLRDTIIQIRTAGEKATMLTRQLLLFGRKAILEPRVLDLNSEVAQDKNMLFHLLGEDIELSTSLDPHLGQVKADPAQVDQMIINLCVNARDAMPRGGKLTIETANVDLDDGYAQAHHDVKPGPYVMLAVTDTGCGMTEEIRARIFEPFFTTKEKGKGTGLGLAMVHGFVKQSSGHVAVYSEPGVGTTFKIYLPRIDSVLPTQLPFHGEIPVPKGTGTILLVEDDDGVRSVACQILQSCGYKVLVAPHGEEGIRLAETHGEPIDLLISDVVMPQISGKQVAERVQTLRPDTKVLFCSGYTDDAVIRHGIIEEKTNFLQKPYSPTSLANKVQEILAKQG